MNIFLKAWNGLNLSPGQRAFLKVVQGLIIGGLLAAFLAIAQYFYSNGAVNWRSVLDVALVAFLMSVGYGLSKYFSAQGDAPVATALTELTDAADKAINADLSRGPDPVLAVQPSIMQRAVPIADSAPPPPGPVPPKG